MGCIPTWTCAPYQGYLTPRFGQQIAWGESNAVVYANSVLGAIVADELYGRSLPVVVLPDEAFHSIADGGRVAIEPDGTVIVRS